MSIPLRGTQGVRYLDLDATFLLYTLQPCLAGKADSLVRQSGGEEDKRKRFTGVLRRGTRGECGNPAEAARHSTLLVQLAS